MNKDVVYIEAEDDITDVITKIENSKEKIVALVPPKKASVFRSIVNIKLIAKAGKSAEKTIVLVTTDPSIVKLAAATKIPVTKNLQSAPAVPKVTEDEEIETVTEEVVQENGDVEPEKVVATEATLEGTTGFLDDEIAKDEAKDENAEDGQDDAAKNDEKEPAATKDDKKSKDKKDKKPSLKSTNPMIRWVQEHKKLTIGCGIGALILIIVLVWAFVIAPSATVTVGVRTTTTNFSENVTFTEKLADEDTSTGKFYLEEKKIENKSEVEFEATGKKNVGEKASGDLVVYTFFKEAGQMPINAGTIFTYDDKLSYISQEDVVLSWDGASFAVCDNKNATASEQLQSGCQMSVRVAVIAENPGTQYNISASSTSWATVANVGVYSDKAMAGGTDEMVTIVQQSDIDAAKSKLTTSNEAVNKAKLIDTIAEDAFIIDASFKQTVGEATSTPAVGEVVEDGKKAKLSVVTTDSIYIIDSTKVEEFIREKAKLADNFKIYEMNDPFIENFTKTDTGYVAKLKTSFVSGPKLTESDVVEVIKGKGVGTARQDLEKTYDGISKINIQTSFPWVTSVPNDNNKITVNIEVDER